MQKIEKVSKKLRKCAKSWETVFFCAYLNFCSNHCKGASNNDVRVEGCQVFGFCHLKKVIDSTLNGPEFLLYDQPQFFEESLRLEKEKEYINFRLILSKQNLLSWSGKLIMIVGQINIEIVFQNSESWRQKFRGRP